MIFENKRRTTRIGLFVVSGSVFFSALRALLSGGLGYWNHKGLVVFAPFAVVLGLAGMVVCCLPDKGNGPVPPRGDKLRLRPYFKRRRRAQ